MKTLLFNGCSFTAGDEVVWDNYCLQRKGRKIDWRSFYSDQKNSPEMQKFIYDYRVNYRRLFNLPMATAFRLGCERVDLSEDGNSNDNIALSTIAYLLSKTPKERKQYHVCIGWTSTSRFMKFIPEISKDYRSQFTNLHVTHVGGNHGQPELKKIQSFVDTSFQFLTDEDLWFNFVRNIMLLENFLITNQITYTFFKALGTKNDVRSIGTCQPVKLILPNDKITNDRCWYEFKIIGTSPHPYENDSWTTTVLEIDDGFLSKENRHPNLNAVNKFASYLAEFIKEQKVI